MDVNELTNRFVYHATTPDTVALYDEIRGKAREYALWLNEHLPEGRDKSLAMTHLESAVYSANAAVARN